MKNDISMEIKKLQKGDLSDLIDLVRLFEVVFKLKNFEIPTSEHLQSLLNNENFQVFVAQSNDCVIGGLTSYVLHQYYSEKPLAYIFDLAVDSELQRQGIGKRLIEFTNAYYTRMGFEEVFVQADRVDDYAIDFYRKTTPTKEEDVLHFYYQLK